MPSCSLLGFGALCPVPDVRWDRPGEPRDAQLGWERGFKAILLVDITQSLGGAKMQGIRVPEEQGDAAARGQPWAAASPRARPGVWR